MSGKDQHEGTQQPQPMSEGADVSQPSEATSGPARAASKGKGRAVSGESQANARGEQSVKRTRDDRVISADSTRTYQSEIVPAVEVTRSEHLLNWQRFTSIRSSLKLKKVVEGTYPDHRIVEERVNALFNQPERNSSEKLQSIDTSQRTSWIPEGLISGEDEDGAKQYGEILCELLKRAPLSEIKLARTHKVGQLLTHIALVRLHKVRGDTTALMHRDMFELSAFRPFQTAWSKSRKCYEATLATYDADMQAQSERTKLDIDPLLTNPEHLAPELPESIRDQAGDSALLTGLNNADQQAHLRAMRLCKHVQYVMFGTFGDAQKLMDIAGAIADQFKTPIQSSSVVNLYEGLAMYNLAIDGANTRITPSSHVAEDIEEGDKLNIIIKGHERVRIAAVLEAMTHTTLGGANAVEAFRAGVEKADKINNAGQELNLANNCHHSDSERQNCIHVCHGCNGLCLGMDLVYVHGDQLHVCAKCGDKDDFTLTITDFSPPRPRPLAAAGKAKKAPAPAKKAPTQTAESSSAASKKRKADDDDVEYAAAATKKSKRRPGFKLRNKLLTAIRTDFPGKPKTTVDARKAVADQFEAKFLDKSNELWRDGFIEADRADRLPKDGAFRTNPFLASIDGALPFYVSENRTFYHHIDNLAPTAGWVNQGCYTWLKSTLQALSAASKLSGLGGEHAANIDNWFDHLWAIRTNYPRDRDARLKIEMEDEKYLDCRKEMKKGILQDAGEEVPFCIPVSRLTRPEWKSEDRKRLTKIIDEMFKSKGLMLNQLTTGGDGSPRPWRPDHMPDDWSWERLEAHMNYHFEVMDDLCDWEFLTDELPEHLFLELMWQWVDNGGRFPRWYIQTTPFAQHAFQWAIGHDVHGQRMLTRWPRDAQVTRIADRDDERCNVLMEPRIWNYMKSDYNPQTYESILKELDQVRQETEWSETVTGKIPPVQLRDSGWAALKRSMQHVPTWKRLNKTQKDYDQGDEGLNQITEQAQTAYDDAEVDPALEE
ncbi:hypothetical protein KC356_g432 [Hortaea werneckii]|nr:hypothetical protein KC356_g432 [Hortaea werneckii]